MFILMLLLILLAGGIFVIAFGSLATSIHLTFFGWQTPELPVGLLILLGFLCGALLLYLVSVLSARNDKRTLNELHKRISELQQQQTMQQRSVPPMPSPLSPLQPNTSTLQMPGMFNPPKY